jgi:hypothetical protein
VLTGAGRADQTGVLRGPDPFQGGEVVEGRGRDGVVNLGGGLVIGVIGGSVCVER